MSSAVAAVSTSCDDLTTSINRSENTVLMDGDVIFREPGLMLRGSSAFIDSDDQLNRIETAQYVLHDFGAHGTALRHGLPSWISVAWRSSRLPSRERPSGKLL